MRCAAALCLVGAAPAAADCPGGNIVKCIEGCPASPPALRQACIQACGTQCPTTPVPTPAPIPDNCTAQVDLVFLLDGSGSISNTEWDLGKQATEGIASSFEWDCDKRTKAGIVQFSGQYGIRTETPLTCDETAFDTACSAMVQVGGGTATGNGMEKAQAVLFGGGSRPEATKVLVLVTDGDPSASLPCGDACQKNKAEAVATELKGNGTLIVAVGVKSEGSSPPNIAFLQAIASTPSSKYVITADNWKALIAEIHNIVKIVCPTPAPGSPAPTPVPTPAPTPAPPLASAPCIRFGHVFPAAAKVDVTVTQTTPANGHSHTFSNYVFGQFSDWVSAFDIGTGKVVVSSNGSTLLEVDDVPLTPGPLVLVLKCWAGPGGCTWPPTSTKLGSNVESVAASFTPIISGAAGRMFNLSPDTKKAGLSVGNGTQLVDNIAFALGSEWVSVPEGKNTYTATDSGSSIATVDYTPDAAPGGLGVFTQWLIGAQAQAGAYGAQLLPLDDAPVTGRCDPSAW